MSNKTIRKGIKVGIPHLFEVWYERIEEIREEVKKMSRKGFLRRTKSEERLAQSFVNLLARVERGIELYLWYGKGFAVKNELGKDIDCDFHHLFGLLISTFNEIALKFDASKISEDLLDHFKRELKILEEQSSRLWNIESCKSTPQGIESAKNEIERFRGRLFDFRERMKPYLKEEEAPKENIYF